MFNLIKSYFLATIVMMPIGLFIIYPHLPKSFLGWASFCVLLLPVWLAIEGIGELMFNERISNSIESTTNESKPSWKRVLYVFFMLIVLAIVISLITTQTENYFSEFISENYN